MSQDFVRHFLATSVANAGTFVVGYPTNAAGQEVRDAGNYAGGVNHYIRSNKYGTFRHGAEVSFAFGASGATITNNTGFTLEAQTELYINFDIAGLDDPVAVLDAATMVRTPILILNLGAPNVLDADGICAAQSASGAGDCTIDGALAANGAVVLDVPRNVIADSGGADTAVLTIYGTDVYGAAMRENITLNGTTAVPGKKAFKTITRVARSATIANGMFLGTGDVLGLPVAIPGLAYVIREMQDGSAATAGTVVAAVRTAATATTGDVRGTYDPNSACDGALVFQLAVMAPNPGDKGVAQYNG